jgi:hypothetical protein
MSKQLLQEFYELCPNGMCPDLLTEREKREISNGAMYLTGRILVFRPPTSKTEMAVSILTMF